MSGLIIGGMLRGVGAGGADFGSMMAQNASREDLLRERLAMMQQIAQDRDATRLAIAGERGAGSGGRGSSGPFMTSIDPGSLAESSAAARMGMSVPEFRQFQQAQQTGDTSSYATQREIPGPTMGGQPLTAATLPPGFDKFMAQKRAQYAQIGQELTFGDKYKDVQAGEGQALQNDVGRGIVSGAMDTEQGGRTVAALKGEGAYKEGGDTVYDQFSGDNDPTAVGKSVITKNNAQAGEAGAKAKAATAGAKDTSLQTLQQMRIAAADDLKEANRKLAEFDKIGQNLSSRERADRAGDRQALVSDAADAQKRLRDIADRLARRLDGDSPTGAKTTPTTPGAAPAARPPLSSFMR